MFRALALAFAVVTAAPAPAQQADGMAASQILTLDQERLFSETSYGRRVIADLERISDELAERNRMISTQLSAEEQALTEQRAALAPEEFRPLADAFDTKVVRLREEQDARIRALQRRRDQERRIFTQRVLPVLSDLAREAGAVAIVDGRAVILSADQIDITDRAIARVDSLLGDGGDLAPPDMELPDDVPDLPAVSPDGAVTPEQLPAPEQ